MLWLPVEGTMAAVIALCANLKEIQSIEFSEQNRATAINEKNSFLKCSQDKHSTDKTYQNGNSDIDQHSQNTYNSPPQTAISDWLSNFQCNDLLCKISYSTLVLEGVVLMTLDHPTILLSSTSGFVSNIPEQLYRPPIF